VLKLSNRFFGALAGVRFFFGFRPRLLGIGKQWVGTDQVCLSYPLLANAVQRLLTAMVASTPHRPRFRRAAWARHHQIVILLGFSGGRSYCRRVVCAAGSPQAHQRTRLSHAEAFQSMSEPLNGNGCLRLLLSIRVQTLSTREASARHAVAAGRKLVSPARA
jgi:hypothetical protein